MKYNELIWIVLPSKENTEVVSPYNLYKIIYYKRY